MASDACAHCGGPIKRERRPTGPSAMYCSKICRSRASYLRRAAAGTIKRPPPRAPEVRVCEWCNQTFTSVRPAAFCSNRCAQIVRDARTGRVCSVDDCDRGVRAKGLCAMHWRREARAAGREQSPKWSERRRANWKKREALKRGADSAEPFSYVDVFERDDWICGICSGPVDPSLVWPDPMSASLDHIVPLSKGGEHSPENAQCSHLRCNIRKGDRLAA